MDMPQTPSSSIPIFDLLNAFAEQRNDVFTFLEGYCPPPCRTDEVRNILVSTNYSAWATGHVAAVVKLAQQFNDLGYKATLCFMKEPPNELVPEGTDYVINPYGYGTAKSFHRRIERMHEICTEREIDTVILNSWQGHYKYWDLLALQNLFPDTPEKRIRVLLHFHSSFTKSQSEGDADWLRNNTRALKKFDGIITLGEVDAAFWRIYHPRVWPRPLPVEYDTSTCTYDARKANRTALYVARFSGIKNQLAAVEAFKHVVDALPDAKLVMAGNSTGNYRDRVAKKAADLGIAANVEIHDYIAGEAKEQLFKSASLALNTSLFEGFPQYLCEAKACGLPVVMFDLPNATIVDGGEDNGAIVVPQGNTKQLGEQMIRVMTDERLRCKLSEAALRHASQLAAFDYRTFWETVFAEIREEAKPLEDRSVQQRMFETLFDAVSHSLEKEREKSGTSRAMQTGFSQNYLLAGRGNNAPQGGKAGFAKTMKRRLKRLISPAGNTVEPPLPSAAKEWSRADAVVVVPKDKYWCAFAAAAFAGSLNAPLLLSHPDKLSDQTRTEIERLKARTVYLAATADSLSPTLEKQVSSLRTVKEVQRIEGADAATLAIACTRALGEARSTTAIIVELNSFRDALPIAPYSYATQSPILFTNGIGMLSTQTCDYIEQTGFAKALVVGGPAIIPNAIYEQLERAGIAPESVTRLAGSNEYRTSRVVSEWAMGKLPDGTGGQKGLYQYASIRFQPETKLGINKVALAKPENREYAALATCLCGKNRSIILLVGAKNASALELLNDHSREITDGYLFDDREDVRPKTIDKLLTALADLNAGT